MVDYSEQINKADEIIRERRDSLINTIITLCSGTVVISATLLEKFVVNEISKNLIIYSWISLIISILCGLKTKNSIINIENKRRKAMLESMYGEDNLPIVINPTKLDNFVEFVFYFTFVSGLIFLLFSAIFSV